MAGTVETLRADATLHVELHPTGTSSDGHDDHNVVLHEPPLDLAHPAESHSVQPHHAGATTTKKKNRPPKEQSKQLRDSASLSTLAKELLPPRSRKKHPYPAFRSTCFTDKMLQPVHYDSKLRSSMGTEAESRRTWSTSGPRMGCEPRLDDLKHSVMYTPSLDRVYDTTVQTMSYRVHMSMWGSSMWDTSERFQEVPRTAPTVGPGSYNSAPSAWDQETKHPRPFPVFPYSPQRVVTPSSKLLSSPNQVLSTPMTSLEGWKLSSEKTVSARPAFDKAPRKTWVDWESTKADRMRKRTPSTPTLALPSFVSGMRTGACRSPPKHSVGT
ncbi:hypothetical protein H257_01758 [Aphanomyces astaci]|uniref:Uncharacterized protein n=1 Tax=Aphanomyces astaci TaxID=112090 RepID=W4H686_APHAT|nr:hypothetical protein H257_01758 [Aphanomyces astaci]ETV86623.1 hypothetical protein H257_01758 [Aphanomyces astaci]|eukprot:XP_009823422.1 hypothetical protein H257_01758 [Aphanomyces astaci]